MPFLATLPALDLALLGTLLSRVSLLAFPAFWQALSIAFAATSVPSFVAALLAVVAFLAIVAFTSFSFRSFVAFLALAFVLGHTIHIHGVSVEATAERLQHTLRRPCRRSPLVLKQLVSQAQVGRGIIDLQVHVALDFLRQAGKERGDLQVLLVLLRRHGLILGDEALVAEDVLQEGSAFFVRREARQRLRRGQDETEVAIHRKAVSTLHSSLHSCLHEGASAGALEDNSPEQSRASELFLSHPLRSWQSSQSYSQTRTSQSPDGTPSPGSS